MWYLYAWMTRRQHGYSLVEIAIALVVMGLLLGGALLPLQERYKQQTINEVRALLDDAKTAVFTYAIQHKTVARKLIYYDGVIYTINAGRPYLPCPDIDNNGLEDRHEVPATLSIVSTVMLTMSVGLCVEEKGMLPWKTLGLKDADPWGNRLTYRVDAAFSDSLTGFDELTRADIFDRRQRLAEVNGERAYALRASRDEAGNVVCSDFVNHGTSGGCPNVMLDNILAGIVTSVALTLGTRGFSGYQDATMAPVSGLMDGAVFVVLSHGSNGRGAINRKGTCQRPMTAVAAAARMTEEANAYYRATHPFVSNEDIGCQTPSAVGGLLRESLFVSAPIAKGGDGNAIDDIVVWASSNALSAFLLRGDVLPINKLEYLPR